MLFNVARFELRYQLRNPVFWVSLFLFFLLGFGVTASENVSIGTPGTVHENAPFAIAAMTGAASIFYLFVITSFVANAIVRDDTTGFGPIVKATAIGKRNYVIGAVSWRACCRVAGLSCCAFRNALRLDDAVGRSRNGRAAKSRLLSVAISCHRHSQYPAVQQPAVRAGYYHAINAVELYRRRHSGDGLFDRFDHIRVADRISAAHGAI
jgi:hypothetical protein